MICGLQENSKISRINTQHRIMKKKMKSTMLTKTKITRINRSPFQEMGQKWQNMQQIARKETIIATTCTDGELKRYQYFHCPKNVT